MKRVKVLVLPSDFSDWNIFDGTPFADNGGDPDGPGWMQDVRAFSAGEVKAAKAAGARVVSGYEADYVPTDYPPNFGGGWCGYGSAGTAYTTSQMTAAAIDCHARAFKKARQ